MSQQSERKLKPRTADSFGILTPQQSKSINAQPKIESIHGVPQTAGFLKALL